MYENEDLHEDLDVENIKELMPTITINRQLRLTDDQYFKEETVKTQLVLHHTVGGSAKSTFDYWQSNPDHIATAYIIERDGTIYETFDPLYWAHHLGLKIPKNIVYNKASIGIELASEGALRSGKELNTLSKTTNFEENWLYAFDIDITPFKNARKLYHIFQDQGKFYDMVGIGKMLFRNYRYFDAYDAPQIEGTTDLVRHLCEQFSIATISSNSFDFDGKFMEFPGIITHVNVRKDKSDLNPGWDWNSFNKAITT